MLIGPRILNLRAQVPDPPGFLPAPTAGVVVAPAAGGTISSGTYYAVVTQRNAYGETAQSPEVAVTVTAGAISVSQIPFPGSIAYRIYLSLPNSGPGTEVAYAESNVPSFSLVSFPVFPATPPLNSTAYLPDTDGAYLSASLVFRWLSEGLAKISYAVGGLLTYSGVPTFAGQGMYDIPGQWLNISDVWYGGYWVQGGRRADFFRRNTVRSSILSTATISVTQGKQCIEVTYQPDRDSGFTTTVNQMGTLDTFVTLTDGGSSFLLPFGFAQIGSEIVAYYQLGAFTASTTGFGGGGFGGGGYGGGTVSGNGLSKMVRGLGNTVPQAWPPGTPVTELSLFWNGKQVFATNYTPGQSDVDIPVPLGWETILDTYMLAQAKKKDQDLRAYKELEDMAFADAQKWMLANKGVASFVQVGGNNFPVVYDATPAGGLIVP